MAEIIVSNSAELSSAISSAIGGDIIKIQDATYTDAFRINDQNYSDWVTFEPADPATRPRLGFTKHERSSKFRIRGLRFSGVGTQGSSTGFDVNACTDVELFDNHFEGGETALKVRSSTRVLVEGNTLGHCGADEIKFSGCNDLTIRNNTLLGIFNPDASDHGDRIQGAGSSTGVLIEGNICFFNHRDEPPGTVEFPGKVFQGFFFDNGTYENMTIRNNFITHTAVKGLADGGSGSNFINCLVENNTVVNVPSQGHPHLTGDYGADASNEESAVGIAGATHNANVGQSGAVALVIQKDDPTQPNFFNDVYTNIMRGMGYVLEDFRPVAGGPADFGSGLGCEARLAELLDGNGGNPPMAIVYSLETQAANGTTNVNPDGTWTYDPNLNFAGSDSWQYRATDDVFNTFSIGTMTGNIIAPVPNAPDGSFSTDANTQASGDLTTL